MYAYIIYNVILYNINIIVTKNNEIMPFAAIWKDLILSYQVNQTKTNVIWHHLYMESKNDTNELIFKTEVDSDIKNKLMVAKG